MLLATLHDYLALKFRDQFQWEKLEFLEDLRRDKADENIPGPQVRGTMVHILVKKNNLFFVDFMLFRPCLKYQLKPNLILSVTNHKMTKHNEPNCLI